ncbi:dynamin family protein [Alicyclobacillus ferrooxydans]|uniref:dynamin family protein n=1 Tax=Alicyclobacillus ferrooxydans TaxID=471514 RepID=UPI0006D53C52|nr:dynamin family protein [Alicyclobacillus ferrooxydans]
MEQQQVLQLSTKVNEAVKRLSVLKDPPSLKPLRDLAERLSDPRRVVAVFGAFSAGKSSLINAFLGQNVLTVSPHPTTATITEIRPTEADKSYAKVRTKSEAEMWEDVYRALRYLHVQAKDLGDAVKKAGQLKSADFPAGARRHVSFLRAAAAGYEQMSSKLGQDLEYPLTELEALTADESIACYLHRVNVYVGMDILDEGMVLVDTPGVDSIHRRHTDVAFDYMRHADAVVFVLYYTHAFARADQNFLSQLAQVQNIAGVNKLFVVINAVDLAASEEELIAVQNRVTEETKRIGIPDPRIYTVSSQTAMAARRLLDGDPSPELEALIRQRLRMEADEPLPDAADILRESGILKLQQELSAYLNDKAYELALGTVDAQFRSLHQALAGRVSHLRELQAQDDSMRREREHQQQKLADELRRLAAAAQNGSAEQEQVLVSEWTELVFHIGQRIRMNLSALFRESFHPSLFKARGNARQSLQQAAADLMEAVNRQIEAEIRTLSLRMQAQVSSTLERQRTELQDTIDGLVPGALEVREMPWDDHVGLPDRANLEGEIVRPFFKFFSNPRQFFEEGGQKEMIEAASPVVMEAVEDVTKKFAAELQSTFLSDYRVLVANLFDTTASQLLELTDESLGTAESLIQYEETYQWVGQQLAHS